IRRGAVRFCEREQTPLAWLVTLCKDLLHSVVSAFQRGICRIRCPRSSACRYGTSTGPRNGVLWGIILLLRTPRVIGDFAPTRRLRCCLTLWLVLFGGLRGASWSRPKAPVPARTSYALECFEADKWSGWIEARR